MKRRTLLGLVPKVSILSVISLKVQGERRIVPGSDREAEHRFDVWVGKEVRCGDVFGVIQELGWSDGLGWCCRLDDGNFYRLNHVR